MLREELLLTREDLAKYPFLPQSLHLLEEYGLRITDLITDKYLLERAVERATSRNYVPDLTDPLREVATLALSILLCGLTRDNIVVRRFADLESKRVSKLFLQREEERKLITIARVGFGLDVEYSSGLVKLHFTHYLRYSPRGDPHWKLVNRIVERGYVELTVRELARLLEEAYERWLIEKCQRVGQEVGSTELCLEVTTYVEQVRERLRRGRGEGPSPRVRTRISGDPYPPCIRNLIEAARAGENLSHIARFTLASFLLNVGLDVDEVVKYFENLPDYDEKRTRYQVEHIAGLRGSRKKYLPPSCDYLRSVGLCPGECVPGIRHPLQYYRLATRGGGVGGEDTGSG